MSTLRVRDITVCTVLLIHLIRHVQCHRIILLELEVVLGNEVEHDVGVHQHVLGAVAVIVVLTKAAINFEAMIGDIPKLISNLGHESLILINIQFLASGRDVNQSSNDSRLRVSNLNRLVSTDEKERIDSLRIPTNAFLIDENCLVGDNAVKQPV